MKSVIQEYRDGRYQFQHGVQVNAYPAPGSYGGQWYALDIAEAIGLDLFKSMMARGEVPLDFDPASKEVRRKTIENCLLYGEEVHAELKQREYDHSYAHRTGHNIQTEEADENKK